MTTATIESRLSSALGVTEEKAKSWIDRWREPHRYYHNLGHLGQMFEDLREHSSRLDVMLAVLFHDIVYWPDRRDNEKQSADFFLAEMPEEFKKNNAELVQNVYTAIIETDHSKPPMSKLGKLICEVDLKILMSDDLNALLEWEHNISKEFQVFPYEQYQAGRIQFLSKWTSKNPRLNDLISYVKFRKLKIGLYAGSFDPFTIGHMNVLQKAEQIFDKVIIARGVNPAKKEWMYRLPSCLKMYEQIFVGKQSVPNGNDFRMVRAINDKLYEDNCEPDLAAAICSREVTLIRGIRNEVDLRAEKEQMAYVEMMAGRRVDHVFIQCDREYEHISSSAFRQLALVSPKHAAMCCPGGEMPEPTTYSQPQTH